MSRQAGGDGASKAYVVVLMGAVGLLACAERREPAQADRSDVASDETTHADMRRPGGAPRGNNRWRKVDLSDVPAEHRAAAKAAVNVFRRTCPAITGEPHRSDVVSIRARWNEGSESNPFPVIWIAERLRWTEVVELEVRLDDRPRTFDDAELDIRQIAGQTLHYFVGHGADGAGISECCKELAVQLCALNVREGEWRWRRIERW